MQRQFLYDEGSEQWGIRAVQDVQPILDANKAAFDHDNRGWKGDGMHHVARIPMVVIEKFKVEQGIDLLTDQAAMRQFLNDPDNKYFRTKPGQI
jgi:hypothetical protein